MSERGTILVVSPYRAEYGPARVLEHVLRALVGHGYRPICVVPPGARLSERIGELGVEIHEVGGLTTFPRTLNVVRLARFFLRHLGAAHDIERIAAGSGARAVYSVSEAIFAAPLAARRASLPSIVHAIGMSIGRPRWGARLYIRFLGRLTDRFVACSSAVAEMFAEHGIDDARLHVVHNAIDVGEIDTAERGSSPVEHEGPRVGMFAAYDSRKGHELFVQAAAIVAKQRPDGRFFLVGGVLAEHAESRAFEGRVSRLIERLGLGNRVVRPGYVPAPQVYDWMRAMDVVVVPSRTEAFAHALLEAMVCGRPIVATGIEGNLDAFVDGYSGVYVERSAESIAAAVLALVDDPARAEEMGRAARERAQRSYSLDVALSAIGLAVSELLARDECASTTASDLLADVPRHVVDG